MKIPVLLVVIGGLLIGGAVGAGLTYSETREKWHELGRHTGIVAGRHEVMRALCDLGRKGHAGSDVAYQLEVKSEFLQVLQSKDGRFEFVCR